MGGRRVVVGPVPDLDSCIDVVEHSEGAENRADGADGADGRSRVRGCKDLWCTGHNFACK